MTGSLTWAEKEVVRQAIEEEREVGGCELSDEIPEWTPEMELYSGNPCHFWDRHVEETAYGRSLVVPFIAYDRTGEPGRPSEVLTPAGADLVAYLSSRMYSTREIADIMEVSRQTFYSDCNRDLFRRSFANGRKHFKTTARMTLFRKAIRGSVPALIYLGKVYLGQK